MFIYWGDFYAYESKVNHWFHRSMKAFLNHSLSQQSRARWSVWKLPWNISSPVHKKMSSTRIVQNNGKYRTKPQFCINVRNKESMAAAESLTEVLWNVVYYFFVIGNKWKNSEGSCNAYNSCNPPRICVIQGQALRIYWNRILKTSGRFDNSSTNGWGNVLKT